MPNGQCQCGSYSGHGCMAGAHCAFSSTAYAPAQQSTNSVYFSKPSRSNSSSSPAETHINYEDVGAGAGSGIFLLMEVGRIYIKVGFFLGDLFIKNARRPISDIPKGIENLLDKLRPEKDNTLATKVVISGLVGLFLAPSVIWFTTANRFVHSSISTTASEDDYLNKPQASKTNSVADIRYYTIMADKAELRLNASMQSPVAATFPMGTCVIGQKIFSKAEFLEISTGSMKDQSGIFVQGFVRQDSLKEANITMPMDCIEKNTDFGDVKPEAMVQIVPADSKPVTKPAVTPKATTPATPQPAPLTPAWNYFVVEGSGVNFRNGPSATAPVTGVVDGGSCFIQKEPAAASANFMKVTIVTPNTKAYVGFVSEDYLKPATPAQAAACTAVLR